MDFDVLLLYPSKLLENDTLSSEFFDLDSGHAFFSQNLPLFVKTSVLLRFWGFNVAPPQSRLRNKRW